MNSIKIKKLSLDVKSYSLGFNLKPQIKPVYFKHGINGRYSVKFGFDSICYLMDA